MNKHEMESTATRTAHIWIRRRFGGGVNDVVRASSPLNQKERLKITVNNVVISLRQKQQLAGRVKVAPCFITWLKCSKTCVGLMSQGEADDIQAGVNRGFEIFRLLLIGR